MVRIAAAGTVFGLILGTAGTGGSLAAEMQGGYGPIPVMQAGELADRIDAGGVRRVGLFWVDLRNEADYKRSFIPGSISIPYSKLSFLAEKFFSKSDEIVFMSYPDSDHVSVNAAIFMKNKGFERCYVLQGGVGAWTGPLETAAPSSTKSKK